MQQIQFPYKNVVPFGAELSCPYFLCLRCGKKGTYLTKLHSRSLLGNNGWYILDSPLSSASMSLFSSSSFVTCHAEMPRSSRVPVSKESQFNVHNHTEKVFHLTVVLEGSENKTGSQFLPVVPYQSFYDYYTYFYKTFVDTRNN